MSLRKLFGEKLSKIRKEHGLTQPSLAELIDMQPHTIGQIETGKRAPSFDTLEKLVAALNIDYSELFDFQDLKSNEYYIQKITKLTKNFDKNDFELVISLIEQINKYIEKNIVK